MGYQLSAMIIGYFRRYNHIVRPGLVPGIQKATASVPWFWVTGTPGLDPIGAN
jgi:hypothetical protein